MKQMPNHNKGFAVVEILLLVFLIALVGFIGYRFAQLRGNEHQNNQSQPGNPNESNSPAIDLLEYGKQNEAKLQMTSATLVINSAFFSKTYKNTTVAAEGYLGVVRGTFQNTTNETRIYNLPDFKLRTPNGQIIELIDRPNPITLAVSGSIEVDFIYSVPAGSAVGGRGALLNINNSTGGGEVTINFKDPINNSPTR